MSCLTLPQASLGHEQFSTSDETFFIHSERCRAEVRRRTSGNERDGPFSNYEGLSGMRPHGLIADTYTG